MNEEIEEGKIKNLRGQSGRGKWEKSKMGTLGVEKVEIVHNM